MSELPLNSKLFYIEKNIFSVKYEIRKTYTW